jgi:hypothetical protein
MFPFLKMRGDGIRVSPREKTGHRYPICCGQRNARLVNPRGLPARLLYTGNEPITGEVTETDAADAELAVHGASSPTKLAATLYPNLFARRHLHLIWSSPARVQLRKLLTIPNVFGFGRHGFQCFRLSFFDSTRFISDKRIHWPLSPAIRLSHNSKR